MTRRELSHLAARLWDGTANPEGAGLLLRGEESVPLLKSDLQPWIVEALVRLARLSAEVADTLAECPDERVRRSAAVLAARAHPLRVAFDD
jgi:hypothetical protein